MTAAELVTPRHTRIVFQTDTQANLGTFVNPAGGIAWVSDTKSIPVRFQVQATSAERLVVMRKGWRRLDEEQEFVLKSAHCPANVRPLQPQQLSRARILPATGPEAVAVGGVATGVALPVPGVLIVVWCSFRPRG